MSEPKSPKAKYKTLDTDDTPQAEAFPIAPTPQTVEVVAPADLSGGYQLSVDVNGKVMVVAVVSPHEIAWFERI